ncbi:hypothetical protein D0T84_01090 [Dysgonomonas sp. 521]|uniref:hypothetical protein n=1 Tax=Dysgonomonas sp. 521 TaxID=2302932 RepID=UPI0013D4C828|nr:hypothetical protein [Dysgonomonas sp. 521]NDV93511.1 hypothetical protein [Dysgonomonas sp. 521]
MKKKIELKPGDTIVGLFKKLKYPGDILHVKDEKRDRYQSIRQEALRHNDKARLLKEIEFWQVKFSVLRTLEEGYTSIVYRDHSKGEA